MTTTPSPDVTSTTERDERKRRKAAIAKYSLAGVALLGIGAALTSAAWTNDAWFAADATAIDPDGIDLRGAFDVTDPAARPAEGAFELADDATTAVTIDPSVFANLTAGDEIETTIWLWNAGTYDLSIAAPTIDATGDLFEPEGATVEVVDAPSTMAAEPSVDTAADKHPVTVKISLPDDADPETFGGTTGSVTIAFQGSYLRS
ncbi:hypothetical protein [Cellulomonas telluris]|uniref:hypothetical protein n=1 Tax=Cellulomonas telluris TaxID=2306636 RepID=UPI0010A872C5|nr:hypothetical protein [Cellulomonas telluris]